MRHSWRTTTRRCVFSCTRSRALHTSLFSHKQTHGPQKPGKQKQSVVPSMLSAADPLRLAREQKRIILVSVSITAPSPDIVPPQSRSFGSPGTLTKPIVGRTESIFSCTNSDFCAFGSSFHASLVAFAFQSQAFRLIAYRCVDGAQNALKIQNLFLVMNRLHQCCEIKGPHFYG